MNFKFYSCILIEIFMLITNSKSDFIRNCSFEYTVDLTTSKKLHNNSFLFNNYIIIPPDLVHEYNYKILNNGTRINNVKPYKRGCICAIIKCLRFCSNQVIEFYKNYSSPALDKGFTKNITLNNKKSIEKHLINDFYIILGNVCEYKNSKMLTPDLNPEHEWTLYEDGILRHHNINRNFTLNEYCFDLNVFRGNDAFQFLNPRVCDKAAKKVPWIQKYGLVFSIPFFIIIILFYCFLSNLWNVRGKCFITYLSLLTVVYSLLSFYKITGLQFTIITCQIYGYILYYTTIGIFIWSCILCYDAWTTLTRMVSEQSSFKKYSTIGFSIPSVMTLLKILANSSTELSKPLNCVVLSKFNDTNLESALIFYDLPGITTVIYSSTLYIMILIYSWKTKREQRRYFNEVQEEQLERMMLYFRILLLMGFEWIFVTISHLLRMFCSKNTLIVTIAIYMAYIITILQGPLMFLIFICTSRVRNEVKKRFRKKSRTISITEERRRSLRSSMICTRETNN